MAERRTQAERRAATRSALVEAGRELFATRGFADVGTEDIVKAAGVTRGALYHHFDNKTELFAEVYEQIERDVVAEYSIEELTGADPFAALAGGAAQFLQSSLDPELQQVALIDGPSVLGWERWREVQTRYGLGLIEAALGAAIEAGQVKPLPLEELAGAMFGTLIEAALIVSRADDQQAALERMALVLASLMEGLRAD